MNKWYIASKHSFILSLLILPFAILSFPIFLGSYFVILSDFIFQPSIDLLGGLIILSFGFLPWTFGTLIIYAHISMGLSVYKLTPDGVMIGTLKKKLIHWDNIVFREDLPFSIGRLRSYWGSKRNLAFLLLADSASSDYYIEYAKKYGVSTLLLFHWFRFLGKPGAWMAWFWMECMLQDVEVSIITPPKEIIWFECNEQIKNLIKQQAHIE